MQRVDRGVGAKGEEVVQGEQIAHVIFQLAEIMGAIGELHPIVMQIARPRYRTLRVDLLPNGRRSFAS